MVVGTVKISKRAPVPDETRKLFVLRVRFCIFAAIFFFRFYNMLLSPVSRAFSCVSYVVDVQRMVQRTLIIYIDQITNTYDPELVQ